jgi:exo-beta-1,3-glucanase (GH17 family)/cellulose synthase/poly-beta-1,6-N-acetylglucosamine synthase-like glycosyltransferase
MRFVAVIGALVACVHAGLWALSRDVAHAPNFTGQLVSVSYTPFDGSAHPDSGTRTSIAQIRADLNTIAPYTRMVRTYSSTGGSELVPEVAQEIGLRVSIGAWIDKNAARNEREIRAVIDLARRHRNIDSIVVGNETIYRAEQTVDELVRKIQRVKRETSVPVTTGEIWHAWIEHPELASAVDFISAHVLPYWEGISETAAVDQAIRIYNQLRQTYPGKRIVIAEFGWPSAGYNRRSANPGPLAQAAVLREFVTRAEKLGIDYNIIEAFDQPWKTFEGGVGPYWGMFNTSREAKFPWTGPITDPDHWKLTAIAVLIGVLLSLPVLSLAGVTVGQAALLAAAAHVVGAWSAILFAFWNGHYFVTGAALAFAFGLVLLIPLILIALARIEEIAAVAFGRKPRRLLTAPPLAPELPTEPRSAAAPKVSIHIPAYMEPPEMLKLTLDAVARLNYPNFECVLVINNTPDPAFWRPVEEHCAALGERFKFVREDNLRGFKAGALRLALAHAADDAEIIGIIDADYVVHPDWLKDLVPAFSDPKVGLIQAPQDHRDGERSVIHNAMNGEYAGFFEIGMVQRNEVNAIIVHGTMCLIRRAALEAAGGWSSDTICEDTDLGLTILEHGWTAHYTNRRYGYGLLPDTYTAYKRQRDRWAYGGFQILKKHWRRFLPRASGLTREQKRAFALGWLNWLGAESIGVLVAIFNLIWVPFVAFAGIAIPDKVLTLPILAAFAVSLTHFVALYWLRVAIPGGQMLGALFAAMSVQWTVARAVGFGLVKDRLPFVRTAKGGWGRKTADFPAFWEAVMAALLIASAAFLHATNWESVREIDLYALVLLVQSLPFAASVGIAMLEASRANDFAFWRSLESKLATILPARSATVGSALDAIPEPQAATEQSRRTGAAVPTNAEPIPSS